MYYMMEKLCRDKSQLDADVQKEYRDYFTAFTEKCGLTPTQYSTFLFGELTTYYSDINGLIYPSMWKNIEEIYGRIKEKELIAQVINSLAQPIEKHFDWATKTENQERVLANFLTFPL